ncbi:MAG: MBOAT family protein [Clostridia bacterium]|nr:MBOAT family protein [Clostridia bacterium]
MSFTSETFIFVFLPLSVIIYLLVNCFKSMRLKNVVLLVLSGVFYAWTDIKTLALFACLTVLTFMTGKLADYSKRDGRREAGKWLAAACVIGVGYLAASRYLPFVAGEFFRLAELDITLESVVVPLGFSFFVFESISYVADVYRGEAGPGRFDEAALFLAFFPKLLSGPVVRWRDFAADACSRKTDSADVAEGISRIITGLAKKVIVADTLGAQLQVITVDMAGSVYDCQTYWLKALLYFFRIYCDFSGYSDIAIGLSRIFGFRFAENFNFPYLSTSVSDFWRRWHISLGAWFREYVYIPLGGNRKGNVYFNLFIVFLLTGIWHGANWTFLLWGVYNALFVLLERFLQGRKVYEAVPKPVKWLITVVIVFFGWVLFSVESLPQAFADIKGMFTFRTPENLTTTWKYYLTVKSVAALGIAAAGSLIGAIPEKARDYVKKALGTVPGTAVQRVIYLLIFIADIVFIVCSTYSPFIYFQF